MEQTFGDPLDYDLVLVPGGRGTRHHIETKSFPVRDAQGKVETVIETFTDITDQVKLEGQLRHAQKMEAIGRMAGEVAHDFNNYLTAIIGYAYVLKMEMEESDPLRHHVEHLLSTTELAAHTTQSLLAFSRKRILTPRLVDFNGSTDNGLVNMGWSEVLRVSSSPACSTAGRSCWTRTCRA